MAPDLEVLQRGQVAATADLSPQCYSPDNSSLLVDLLARKNIISGGSSGLIQRLPCGNVSKCAYPEDDYVKQLCLRDIAREFQVYQKLPQHDRLLQVIRYSPKEGLVLPFMPRGSLRDHLQNPAARITLSQRLQWACDAAESLQLLHSHNVIHGDVHPNNFLLDSNRRLKIIGFSGSSFDGIVGSALEGTRFFLTRSSREPSTVRADLFALGSTLYEIMTGKQPYETLSNEEVKMRYAQSIFPDVQEDDCREVVLGCWRAEVKTAEEAMMLIKTLLEKEANG